MQSKPATPNQPFITRRSVAIAWAGSLVMVLIVGSSKATQNGQGLLLFQGVGSPAGGGSPMGGTELWASDGQQGGQTYLVLDINPGSGSSFPQQFRPVGTVVVFAATTDATGTELWVTDGTAAGTRLVKDILPGPGNGITTFF